MMQLEDFGYADREQCVRLLSAFILIEDAEVREGVLALLEDLAAETGELIQLDPSGRISFFS